MCKWSIGDFCLLLRANDDATYITLEMTNHLLNSTSLRCTVLVLQHEHDAV